MKIVDLRSDTVTLPTPEMRKAMYDAELGDDVYGEDPTVTKLEELGAEMMAKEAAMFVASGTMGNQIAAMTHTQRGDEVICEAESHIYYYEVGGLAYLAGVQARPVKGMRGIISSNSVGTAIRCDDIHQPRTSLICLENTHNRAGGTCYKPSELAAIRQEVQKYKIPIHIDGARIFNAAVAQHLPVAKFSEHADSVSFCLSKGLCAPVGSLLVGSKAFIDKARRIRKMIGGGMRQAGVIAAAGIVALHTMVERLAEDHHHAQTLAQAIQELGFGLDLTTVQTNIVLFSTEEKGITADSLSERLNEYGIKVSQFGDYKIRLVTHYGITADDIQYVVNKLIRIVKG